jgi:phosphoribosylformylglycinamidine synthase
LGATIDLTAEGAQRLDQLLFNETQSRIVISTVPENAEVVLHLLAQRGLPAHRLGTVGGGELTITAAGETLRWAIQEIHADWYNAIADVVRGDLSTP